MFGYPGSLPQVFREGGCTRFVTQKLSWNKQNRFPHHSFTWEGIDGSTVVAHFPPVETYNSELTPAELTHASANFSDHAWSDRSLVPFGHGDGGGGPTSEMLERARLLADIAGLPQLTISSPGAFFEELEAELAKPGTPHWRASSTSRCIVGPSPPRHTRRWGTGAARSCCARWSSGRPLSANQPRP
ncbi:MAG: hypothetical protein M5U19_09250 [Microthrixaceae bacterium]|nr:hypothetical protein [Microthrixaceae bacterium]